jgi:6-phosphogluconolactonase
LPGAASGDTAAGLALSADGRYLFAGLRGADRIATVGLDADAAYPVGWASSGGHWPRHLIVDGDFLHVANQLSNEIATFSIGADGTLEQVGEPVAVPSPTCLAALS